MRVRIRRNRENRSCYCIKRKIEKKQKQWFELGKENLKELNAKDQNLQKQLILRNTLCRIRFLSKSSFRKQFLKMCPEEGLCSHVLSSNLSYNGEGSRARNGQNEELKRQDQSENRAEENGNVGSHDLNGHVNNRPNIEGSTSDVIMDTVFQDTPSVVETTHTLVETKTESDEAIVSMLDYLITL